MGTAYDYEAEAKFCYQIAQDQIKAGDFEAASAYALTSLAASEVAKAVDRRSKIKRERAFVL